MAEHAASAANGAQADVSYTLLRLIQDSPLKGTGLVLREEANASNMKHLNIYILQETPCTNEDLDEELWFC